MSKKNKNETVITIEQNNQLNDGGHMSQRSQSEAYVQDLTNTATEAAKTYFGWQWKASQTMLDQAVKAGQAWMDLSQETYKAGSQVAEGLRKDFLSMTDKYMTPPSK